MSTRHFRSPPFLFLFLFLFPTSSRLLLFVSPQPTRYVPQKGQGWSLQAVCHESRGAINRQWLQGEEGPLDRQAGVQGAASLDQAELLPLPRTVGRVSRKADNSSAR